MVIILGLETVAVVLFHYEAKYDCYTQINCLIMTNASRASVLQLVLRTCTKFQIFQGPAGEVYCAPPVGWGLVPLQKPPHSQVHPPDMCISVIELRICTYKGFTKMDISELFTLPKTSS